MSIPQVSWSEALQVWLKIGLLSFGGPAGQIALMHRIIVEEKKWLDEKSFLHALNYCMLLPGPEAQQLATYMGWLLQGVKGGFLAGILFILPGSMFILAFSIMYVLWGQMPIVAGVMIGLKGAVFAIMIQALLRVSQRALNSTTHYCVAVGAFCALFFFKIPFPFIIFSAALVGYLSHRQKKEDSQNLYSENVVVSTKKISWVLAGLWLGTLLLIVTTLSSQHTFAQIALFFSKLATVTFGGAYAVLAYVGQEAVETYHWLQASEMMDALGLAETTPGPLILVTQFVGFLAGYRYQGGESVFLGVLGAGLTLWVTFLPCFFWIFAGAPYVEKLRHNKTLHHSLSGITAAIVGVIANLTVWFALHSIFTKHQKFEISFFSFDLPIFESVSIPILLTAFISIISMFFLRFSTLKVLLLSILFGVLLNFLI